MKQLDTATRTGMREPDHSRLEASTSFLVIVACMLLTFGNALTAEFYMVEERTLLGLQPWTIQSWYQSVVDDAVGVQRFRPLYMAYVAFGASWFARNPFVWHLITLLWGATSLFLFYRAARLLGASILVACVFVVLVAFRGNQSSIWVNLIPQETLGVLFLSIAAWALSIAPGNRYKGRWDALGMVALACAGLVKESFILVVPAMLMFRLLLESRAIGSMRLAFANLRPLLVAGGLFFAVGIIIVLLIMASKPKGYSATVSGLALASFRPDRWWQLLSGLGLNLPLLFSAVSLAVCAWRRPDLRMALAVALVIAAAWLAPQFVLYTKGMDGRYAYPAIISVSALIALGLAAVPRGLLFLPQLALLVVLVPTVGNAWLYANRSANWLAAETVSMNRLVQYVAQNVPATQSVVIAGDAGTGYGLEALHYSLPIFLQTAGSRSTVYAWPLISKGARDPAQMAHPGGPTAIADPSTLDPSRVGAIIIVDTFTPGLHAEPLMNWLSGSQWSEISFAESYRYVGDLRRPSIIMDEVRHKVMVPARMVPTNDVVTIDYSVVANVGVTPLVDAPPWGVEKDYAGPGKIVWLGYGDEQGMGGVLTAAAPQTVTVSVEVVAGPSKAGPERTVELELGIGDGRRVSRGTFKGDTWDFRVDLRTGGNPFRLRIVDPPTVAELPSGDKRTLMALVRRITVRE